MITLPDPVTKYGYDTRDRITDIENANHSRLHYAYDAAGQKVSQTLTTPDQQSWTIGYTYDAVGNLATVTATATRSRIPTTRRTASKPTKTRTASSRTTRTTRTVA